VDKGIVREQPNIIELPKPKAVVPKLAFVYDSGGKPTIREEELSTAQTWELLSIARAYCEERIAEELAKVRGSQFVKQQVRG
jgi:hypothetical protein